MWKLLLLLVTLADIFSIVSSVKESETTIITSNAAAAAASGVVVENGENGTVVAAGAAAAAAASSTTIIKTEHNVKKCAVNERYSKCPEKLCQPQVCEDVGVPQCSIHDEKYFDKTGPCPGPPACICKEGFVRNDEGVCMPATECPSCGNDKNATAGCGVNCGRRCSNHMLSDVACIDICYSNSCDCKKGYVFDDYLGFCVLPKDCSNQNAPEPEGTEGTPGNEDGNDGTDPCDDCSENNCDNTNENIEDIGETDCNGIGGESTTESRTSSTTRRPRTTTKRSSRTTTKSSGGSEMTTEGSAMSSTTRRHRTTTKRSSRTTTESDGGSDLTTKGSGMSTTTRNNKINIQIVQSTTESSEETESTAEGSNMTTDNSGNGSTTENSSGNGSTIEDSSGNGSTTEDSENGSTVLDSSGNGSTTEDSSGNGSTTEDSGNRSTVDDSSGNGSTTEDSEKRSTVDDSSGNGSTTEDSSENGSTTEDSGNGSTVEDSENGSTTEETETNMTTEESENGSTTEEMETEMTTEDSGNESTTEEMNTGMTTGKSEAGSTTEETESGSTIDEMETDMTTKDSGNEETTEQYSSSPNSQRTTTKAPTSTTTRRTRKPRTTTRRSRTTTKRRTTSSAAETTMKSTTRQPRRTTTKSVNARTTTMTKTEASTTKGPKDCRGRNEWYFDCAPSCPQRTCEDYLNGVRCQASDRTSGCKPECRCMIGFYKDPEGNCVSILQCRQLSSNTGMMSTTTTSTTAEPTCEEEAIPLFAVGSLRYTLRILYEISLSNPGNSVIVGGASVLYLMGELALFAKGRAKTELLNVFNLRETEQISCAFPRISAALTTVYPDIEFSLFCKIYADNDCPMTDEFIQNTEQIFAMAPQNLDFSASDAAKKISDEVEVMTNGNFENYLKTRTISTLNNLIMVDAEGFQGKWEKQFNPADTTLTDFYWSGRISKVQSMYLKDTFLYGESSVLGAKILKMNYVGGMFGLVIFLPNSLTGLNDLLKKLQQNTNVVYSAVGGLTMQMVEINLPKFEISVANRLKMPSEKAGVTRIFSNTSIGLENVASCEMPYVSEILQKITFHVDEYGMGDSRDVDFAPIATTQAPRRQTFRFKADHAFVYSLFHKEVMLQAGIFAGN